MGCSSLPLPHGRLPLLAFFSLISGLGSTWQMGMAFGMKDFPASCSSPPSPSLPPSGFAGPRCPWRSRLGRIPAGRIAQNSTHSARTRAAARVRLRGPSELPANTVSTLLLFCPLLPVSAFGSSGSRVPRGCASHTAAGASKRRSRIKTPLYDTSSKCLFTS